MKVDISEQNTDTLQSYTTAHMHTHHEQHVKFLLSKATVTAYTPEPDTLGASAVWEERSNICVYVNAL